MATPPDYKQLTYPQLRSFCQVARSGSMKAAADALGVAQPTVWKQIHALEKTLGVSLVTTGRSGSALTAEGRTLLELCGPAVNDIDSLERRFRELATKQTRDLIVAASPRVCHEDLPAMVSIFANKLPHVHLRFRELAGEDVVPKVESGEAHIGLGDIADSVVPEELAHRHCYDIEPIAAIPAGHPLATRQRVSVKDLSAYPVLNAPNSFPSVQINQMLTTAGAWQHPERKIELQYAHSILRYVALGHGVGIIGHPVGWNEKPPRRVVEKRFTGKLELLPVHAIFRKKSVPDPIEQSFIDLLEGQW